MIRLLIIGRDADEWRQGLGFWEGKTIQVDCETLPAAGIRKFGDSSPDAVAIAEPDQSPKIEPIVQTIRERPLGQIVPVLLLGASYLDDEELHVAAAVEASDGAKGLVVELEEILGVNLEPDARHAQTESDSEIEITDTEQGQGPTLKSTEIPVVQPGAPEVDADAGGRQRDSMRDVAADVKRQEIETEIEHRDYVIERLDEPDGDAASSSSHDAVGAGDSPQKQPDAEDIRRKLKEVRHENYFVVLDVERGCDGDEVRRAYRRLKARFRPRSLDNELASRFEPELEEINDALDDARAVLGDEELRANYLSETTRK